ncbi:MAG: lysophospholipid acyltransferase family protein [Candidatus Nanopelagicales bacterium]
MAMPPGRVPGPSKAARLVGNTGPRPVPARPAGAHRPPAAPAAGKARRMLVAAPAPAPAPTPEGPATATESWLDFARRRLSGDYAVDDFGFDPEFTDRVLLAVLRPLYTSWFRVETSGLANVPADSGALVVANHSGTIALDAVMTQLALHDEHPAHRHLRMLGANLVFQTPFIGDIARKAGHTLACHPDAERLLSAGELVGVWPEGFKGVGKPFSQRYKLQRFGRGGFVAAALRTRSPIIPTAIVGAEETYPMIGNASLIARILGLPYFPITPTWPWLGPLGLVPLPSKWLIHFGEPIPTDGYPEGAADDPMVVFNLTDQVREQIQQTIYRLLVKRPSAFG